MRITTANARPPAAGLAAAAVIALALPLAGCWSLLYASYSARTQAAARACAARMADPALDPIRARVPLRAAEALSPSFAMLTDTSLPSEPERAAIAAWNEHLQQCDAELEQVDIATGTQRRRAAFAPLVAQLYNRELTYGQFAQRQAVLLSRQDPARAREDPVAVDRAWLDAIAPRPACTVSVICP